MNQSIATYGIIGIILLLIVGSLVQGRYSGQCVTVTSAADGRQWQVDGSVLMFQPEDGIRFTVDDTTHYLTTGTYTVERYNCK